jgi:ribosomal-protein-alanine N-acetyltransferase
MTLVVNRSHSHWSAKSEPPLETERLILRDFEADDLEALFRIQNDLAAMPLAFFASDIDQCRNYHETHAKQRGIVGFAPWVAVLKATAEIVGWGGLQIDPFDPGWGIEVGYFFHPAHRRQGLASELVQASLAHGFEDLTMDEIGAFARPANVPSIGVLEKAGFRFVRYEPKLERNRYVISAAEWRRSGRKPNLE